MAGEGPVTAEVVGPIDQVCWEAGEAHEVAKAFMSDLVKGAIYVISLDSGTQYTLLTCPLLLFKSGLSQGEDAEKVVLGCVSGEAAGYHFLKCLAEGAE